MQLQTQSIESNIDINSSESRKSMAKLVTKLFELWKLPAADQLNLLGLSETSRAMLTKYRKGNAIPNSRDMIDRVGLLLSIHKSLRLLYPYNNDFRQQWVSKRNQMMNNSRPVEIMKEKGIIGIATVTRHLDFLRGQ
ncbi:MAG: hypothetical protein L3J69_10105 [Desulfobacula sp.]|nr:hypothetical protein [Desulfobacula sp.]